MWLSGTDKNKAMHKKAVAWLETQVSDPVLREKLRPKNEFGCKRPLFLNDWYPMFNQANVELVTEKPIRITEHGIVSKSPQLLDDEDLKDQPVGAYEVRVGKEPAEEVTRDIDVLIWGTGNLTPHSLTQVYKLTFPEDLIWRTGEVASVSMASIR